MDTKTKIKETIGFIGGGNMAKAICEGIVRKGLMDYSQLYVSAPHIEHLQEWNNLGAHITTENGMVVTESDVIFLAVKPHVLPEAVANVYETLRKPVKGKLFVSILAGVTLEALENCLATLEGSRVIRVMPNTPMMVGEGCTVFCPGQRASDADIALVKALLETSGVCQQVPESLINAVGAVAGSGPAFVYLIIEALSDGGVKMGIPRAMATHFAAQTVLGAAKMVLESGKHTGTLKDEVCSPGGTTITGIHALEKGGVSPYIKNLNVWKELGAHITTDNSEVAHQSDVVFLAVKPHILNGVLDKLIHDAKTKPIVNKLFVSILAGITLKELEEKILGFEGSRVIRVMPNTPMLVGEGCTVYCPGQNVTEEDLNLIETILEVTGMCQLIPEKMINAVGAIASSGPAFVYLFIEALSDGGVRMGLHRDMSTKIAAQTVMGAAKMVMETNRHMGTLKDEVCSAGGTTIAGIHALENGGVRGAVMNAVQAAAKRAEELAK
ncbi:pyrroline-5-carboxylate reductase 3 [Asbolus verrucosus]|uniref:Pyrroline-5-carboxylate reductase n=1 Tax=Asbolus verrucosus TaxID=1661398 RepID=A0A482VEM4_ASBVE|nr:pyrroline-5-carboxylate reductase 3 [Asbolus verrucosus]